MFKRLINKYKEKTLCVFIKWLLISVFIGLFSGIIGGTFYHSIHIANELRAEHQWLIYLLPIGGIVITFLYHICKMDEDKGTNLVIASVRGNERLSALTAPLIFVSSAITHLFGGSAGKEGAALQIGGSIASGIAKLFKLGENDKRILIMCGMSAVFSSIFGTPVTAAVFSMEIVSVGMMQLSAIVPCTVASVTGMAVGKILHVPPTSFTFTGLPELNFYSVGKVLILSILTALLSILFCTAMHKTHELYEKFFPNKYIRAAVGGAIIIILTLIVGNQNYNGAGMEIIEKAFTEKSEYYAFILKILFTALTLGAGYKGGEIVPVFYTGATFGNVMGRIMNLSPSFSAGIGLVSLFCGVTNCPLSSLLLSVELFGSGGFIYFLISISISFMLSGYHSLYNEQRFIFSKIKPEFIN